MSRISRRRLVAQSDGGAGYAAKRAQLIRIAAQVFFEKGYAAATLNDVAAVFGTDRASLYYYVGGKEELLRESVTDLVQRTLGQCKAVCESDLTPVGKLRRLIGVIVESQVEHYPALQVFIRESVGQRPTEDREWTQTMTGLTQELERCFALSLEEGIAGGDFRQDVPAGLLAHSLLGMILWTHHWFVPGGSYTADEVVASFEKVYFDGVAA